MSNAINGKVNTEGTLKGSLHTGAEISIESIVKMAIAQANKVTTVTLYADKWEGTASPYSQVITISAATENSKIDLNPTIEQLNIFHNKDIAFVVENDSGIITVYCVGQKPKNDYTMQATITEVIIDA